MDKDLESVRIVVKRGYNLNKLPSWEVLGENEDRDIVLRPKLDK